MKPLPDTNDPLVLRTDFSDDSTWNSLCAVIRQPTPVDGFLACVEFLSDPEYTDLGLEELLGLNPNIVVFYLSLTASHSPILTDLFWSSMWERKVHSA